MELSGSRVEMDINNIIENSLIRMLNKKKRSVSIHKQLGEIPCPVGFPDQRSFKIKNIGCCVLSQVFQIQAFRIFFLSAVRTEISFE